MPFEATSLYGAMPICLDQGGHRHPSAPDLLHIVTCAAPRDHHITSSQLLAAAAAVDLAWVRYMIISNVISYEGKGLAYPVLSYAPRPMVTRRNLLW